MAAESLARETAALQDLAGGRTLAFGDEQAFPLADVEWARFETGTDQEPCSEHLPGIADMSVDTVLCVFALERSLDPYACLQQWSRILREGGRLALLMRMPAEPEARDRHAFPPSYLVKLVNQVGGFLIQSVEQVTEGKSWLLSAKRSLVAGVRIPLGTIGPELANRAKQSAEAKAELYFQFGAVLLQAGDPALAETCFRHAMSLEGTNAEVLFGLGMSAAAQGRWREALTDLQKVVALTPDNEEARRWVLMARERTTGAAV